MTSCPSAFADGHFLLEIRSKDNSCKPRVAGVKFLPSHRRFPPMPPSALFFSMVIVMSSFFNRSERRQQPQRRHVQRVNLCTDNSKKYSRRHVPLCHGPLSMPGIPPLRRSVKNYGGKYSHLSRDHSRSVKSPPDQVTPRNASSPHLEMHTMISSDSG